MSNPSKANDKSINATVLRAANKFKKKGAKSPVNLLEAMRKARLVGKPLREAEGDDEDKGGARSDDRVPASPRQPRHNRQGSDPRQPDDKPRRQKQTYDSPPPQYNSQDRRAKPRERPSSYEPELQALADSNSDTDSQRSYRDSPVAPVKPRRQSPAPMPVQVQRVRATPIPSPSQWRSPVPQPQRNRDIPRVLPKPMDADARGNRGAKVGWTNQGSSDLDGEGDQPETWQDDLSLVECNLHMLANEIRCDTTILVGESEEALYAHSYVLRSRSSKMDAILAKQSTNGFSSSYLAVAHTVKPSCMRHLLRFIYSDEIEIDNVKQARDLIDAAEIFGPRTIKGRCFRYLLGEMSSENVCVTLELSHIHNDVDVHARCLHFIYVNAGDVLADPGFAELCRECVEEIVKSDNLNASELQVYDVLVGWAMNECSKRREEPNEESIRDTLSELLYHVRFPVIDIKEFTEKLSTKNIIKSEEKILLFQYFHGGKQSLPNRFNVKPRKVYVMKEEMVGLGNTLGYSSNHPPVEDAYQSRQMERFNGYDPRARSVNMPTRRDKTPRNMDAPVRKVNRYKDVSGPWLLKGMDAIAFRCSQVIELRGVQVYGPYTGKDQYNVKLVVYDEGKFEVRNENSTLACNDRSKKVYDVRLVSPVRVPKNKLFTVGVRMTNGVPTYQGSNGLYVVRDGDVDIEFKSSNKSFNGTDADMGQIPGLLFTAIQS